MAKTSPAEFVSQVRQEVAKVTWISRKETMVTTSVVLVVAVIVSLFFLLVDTVIVNIVQAILGI